MLVTNVLLSRLGQVGGGSTVEWLYSQRKCCGFQPGPNDSGTVRGNHGDGGSTERQEWEPIHQEQVFSADYDTNLINNTAKATITIIPGLPMISNLVVTPMASSAFVRWKTGALATAQVQYGLTPSYGSASSVNATPSSNHLVLLTGLMRDTNYYFNVLSSVGGTLYSTNSTFATTNTLILNTQDADYSGLWISSSVGTGIYENGYYQTANATNINPTASAVYAPDIPVAGNYDVFIWHPQSSIYTTNAQVYVSGATNEVIDRRERDDRWRRMGHACDQHLFRRRQHRKRHDL